MTKNSACRYVPEISFVPRGDNGLLGVREERQGLFYRRGFIIACNLKLLITFISLIKME